MSEMDLNTLLAVTAGLLLRLGIPILLTVLAAWGLHRLDQHWKRQAEHTRPSPIGLGAAPAEVRCWEQADCPPEKREACPAYAQPSTPCWQLFRTTDGELAVGCLRCDVFRHAPARA
jgi:hypothetical protein